MANAVGVNGESWRNASIWESAIRTLAERASAPPSPSDLQSWRRVQANSQPAICRMVDGIPDRVDRLRSLGNAVVPQVAEVIGLVIADRFGLV